VRITHVTTFGIEGGASQAAYRLHKGLCAVGEDSRILSLYKTSPDPAVLEFDPPRDWATRVRRGLRRRYLQRSSREIERRAPGSTAFSDDRSQHGADIFRQLPPSDVVNLHWVAGFIDYQKFFQHLPADMRVVWTLHDMNPFTGGCHYDGGCGRFSERCGVCPQLNSKDPGDLSSEVWARKRRAFGAQFSSQVRVVAPSRWLAVEAKKSSLFGNLDACVIPNGLDLEIFRPRGLRESRERLGVPLEDNVVLFVADSGAERRKGLSVLLEALDGLQFEGRVCFLAVGGDLKTGVSAGRFKVVEKVSDEVEMSFVYSAADMFIVPSLQENLPNTALEALSCGVPAVGSRVGGIPEVISHGLTGLLVPPGDPRELRGAITALLGSVDLRAAMGREARDRALREFSMEAQAKRYSELYELLAGAGSGRE
jgi:glycosyltransferase involved in cell wall biosynthesis